MLDLWQRDEQCSHISLHNKNISYVDDPHSNSATHIFFYLVYGVFGDFLFPYVRDSSLPCLSDANFGLFCICLGFLGHVLAQFQTSPVACMYMYIMVTWCIIQPPIALYIHSYKTRIVWLNLMEFKFSQRRLHEHIQQKHTWAVLPGLRINPYFADIWHHSWTTEGYSHPQPFSGFLIIGLDGS